MYILISYFEMSNKRIFSWEYIYIYIYIVFSLTDLQIFPSINVIQSKICVNLSFGQCYSIQGLCFSFMMVEFEK